MEGTAPLLSERGPIEVQRAAQTFNLMQRRLSRFLEAQTRMLAAISHDLRTPLTRIRLRLEMPPDSDSNDKMLHDLTRMEQMLAAALSFLRDQHDLEAIENIDLASLLEALCDEFADMGNSTVYSGPVHYPFRGRPQALERAFTNLIDNATQFGTKATVRLLQPAADQIAVDIQDNGPGISEVDKLKVFEPFYRSDNTRNCDDSGVGLGLSIVQTIITSHGGEIELHDCVPHGLIVRVLLPAASLMSTSIGTTDPRNTTALDSERRVEAEPPSL
jgi:signal transduction histidine kinase